jgi:integrase
MPDLSTIRGRRDRAILEVLSRAGLRRAEVVALRCDELIRIARWDAPTVRGAVADGPAEETEWALHVAHSKRGRSRDVPLARSVVRALASWQATSVAQRAQRAAGRPFLFVSVPRARGQTPQPLSTAAIGRIVARYAAAAGIPEDRRTPHALRHTFCTAVAARAGVDEVKRLAGHADIRTSMKYVEVSDQRAAEVIAVTFNTGAFYDR